MPQKVVNGKEYLSTREAAELWGLKVKTVTKYANATNGIIPGCIKHDGRLFIPANAIRPITQSVAQGILWAIIRIKNDPDSYLDLTQFGIRNSQLNAVLNELERKLYIISPENAQSERDRLLSCRITERGFGLVEYRKRLNNDLLRSKIASEYVTLAFSTAQTIMQAVQLVQP